MSGPSVFCESVAECVTGELWFLDCEASSRGLEEEERRVPRLSSPEILRAREIRDDRERHIWRAAHIALRVLVERWAGESLRRAPFELSPSGRPSLPRPAPVFNLSHAGPFALIGLTRGGLLGVDIQEIAPRLIEGARRARIEDYALRIAKGAPLPEARDRRFVQAWTRIEALAKADGRGIGKTLTEAGLVDAAAAGAHSLRLVVRDVAAHAGYAAAVAAPAADWSSGLETARDFALFLAGARV